MTRARNLANLGNKNAITADVGLFNIGIGSTQPTNYKLDVVGGNAYIGGGVTITGNLSVGGTITYQDVTNVDAVGIITAAKGFRATAGGVVVTAGVSTFPVVAVSAGTTTKDLLVTGVTTFRDYVNISSGVLDINDSIRHINDTDTKISFTGFNTITATTGGTERVRITSAGKVGLGTNNPIFKLDVVNGSHNTGANANNPGDLSVSGSNKTLTGGGANVFINSNANHAVDTGGSLGFSGRNTDSSTNSVLWATIKGAKENGTSTNTAGYLAFASANHDSGGLVERARIHSTGQLTVGTSLLTSSHSSFDDFVIKAPDAGNAGMTIVTGTSNQGTIAFSDGTSGTAQYQGYLQYSHNGDKLALGAGGDDRVIITSNGRVGIASAIPQSALDVYGEITLPINNTLKWVLGTTLKYDIYSNSGGTLIFRSAGSEKARFDSNGDCGIGNNSPSCRLSIKDTATHTAYASAAPSIGDCMVQVYNNPSSETTNDHSTIQFGVNGGTHNRVNSISAVAESAGNRKLAFTFCTDEAGSRTEKLRITGDGDIHSVNKVQSGGNTTSGFIIGAPDVAAYIGVQSKSVANGGSTSNAAYQAWLGSTNTFRVNANGLIKTNAGVDFSGAQTNLAGMTSEILDSYEEGTWTAGLATGSATHDKTAYIKIGTVVHIWGRMYSPTNTSSSNNVTITGLPFAVADGTAVGSCFGKDIDNLNVLTVFVNTDENLYFYGLQNSNAWNVMKHDDFGSNVELYYHATYRTS